MKLVARRRLSHQLRGRPENHDGPNPGSHRVQKPGIVAEEHVPKADAYHEEKEEEKNKVVHAGCTADALDREASDQQSYISRQSRPSEKDA